MARKLHSLQDAFTKSKSLGAEYKNRRTINAFFITYIYSSLFAMCTYNLLRSSAPEARYAKCISAARKSRLLCMGRALVCAHNACVDSGQLDFWYVRRGQARQNRGRLF